MAITTRELTLDYTPPYDWERVRAFIKKRLIVGVEWLDECSYGRTLTTGGIPGRFTATHRPRENTFHVHIETKIHPSCPDDLVANIRRVLDLDANSAAIDEHLRSTYRFANRFIPGLRIPRCWDVFEAGVRAVLGQPVSVSAATHLTRELVQHYGARYRNARLFPSPDQLSGQLFDELRMPHQRKATLARLAAFCLDQPQARPEQWLKLKGIGPWTIDYARLRGEGAADIFLSGDLGVKRKLAALGLNIDPTLRHPWGSYLTFQLWHLE